MMKKFYISAWFLLVASAFISLFNGSFNSAALFVFSLVALVLVLAAAMWSVIVQTRDFKTE
jgi:hypothetical protein